MKHLLLLFSASLFIVIAACSGNTSATETDPGSSDPATASTAANSDAPSANEATAKEPEYLFDHAQLLTLESLSGKTLEELALMRNEIYARLGYKFKSADLQSYFLQAGFSATSESVEDQLTETDRTNIGTIVLAESQQRQKLQEQEHSNQDSTLIQLADIEFTAMISAKFVRFLEGWLTAAFQQETTILATSIYPGFEMASTDMIIGAFGKKEESDELNTVTYAVAPCENSHCGWCGEELGVPKEGEMYTLSKTWLTEDPEAIRDGSQITLFFVEVEDTFQIYCMSAAG